MASKPSPTKRTEKPTSLPPPSPTGITVNEDSLESSIESSDEDNSPPPNVAEKTEGFVKRMVARVSRLPMVQVQKDFIRLVKENITPQRIFQALLRRKPPSTILSEGSASNTRYFGDDAATNKGSERYNVVLVGAPGVGKNFIKTLKCVCGLTKDCTHCNLKMTTSITHHNLPGICRLFIVDTTVSTTHASLMREYLKHLDCAMFVFSLDNPSSLSQCMESFQKEFDGSMEDVKKFLVGTKGDAGVERSTELQDEAFAKQINAELCIIPENNSGKVQELFAKVGEALYGRTPSVQEPVERRDHLDELCFDSAQREMLLHGILVPPVELLRYPGPVEFDIEETTITDIYINRRSLAISAEDDEFTWGTSFENGSQEPVSTDAAPSSKETSCHKKWLLENQPSTWQQDILGDHIIGVRVKRQPTRTEFTDIEKMYFSSSKRNDSDREKGLFYTMMLTTAGKLLEWGLVQGVPEDSSAAAIRGEFQFTPQPIDLTGDINDTNSEIVSTSMSSTHAAVALSDGTVLTWGDFMERRITVPGQIPLERKVTQVACGIDFTVLLTDEGKVFSYGSGQCGQLGHGDEEDKHLPTMIENVPENITKIAAGNHHVAVISKRGALYGWGSLSAKAEHVKTPKDYSNGRKITVKSVSCGARHTLCTANKKVYTMGSGSLGQLGYDTDAEVSSLLNYIPTLYKEKCKIQAVSAGKNHSAFLTTKGEVFTCGCNQFGQLGYLTDVNYSIDPRKVNLGQNADKKEIRADKVSCSEDCTIVLTKNKEVLIWGKCFYGDEVKPSLPVEGEVDVEEREVKANTVVDVALCAVPHGNDLTVTELAFGLMEDHSMLLLRVGNSSLDHKTTKASVPCDQKDLACIRSVGSVLLSVNEEGKMFFTDTLTWCTNSLVPDHDTRDLFSAVCRREASSTEMPQLTWKVCTLPDMVADVQATLDTFFIRTEVGDVYSWKPSSGKNIVEHVELDDRIIKEISCGLQHAAVLTDNGVILTCGTGSAGQLGHGAFENALRFQPVLLMDPFKVSTICCGPVSTAALTMSGKVFFWGQLDLPEHKRKALMLRIWNQTSLEAKSCPMLLTRQYEPAEPFAFELSLEDKGQDQQVAVVGKPFEMEINPRHDHVKNRNISPEVFRVEARSTGVKPTIVVKGKVKKDCGEKMTASIQFSKKDTYEVSTTVDGKCLGRQFIVRVEERFLPRRRKVTLLGENYELLRSVGAALEDKESRSSFEDSGLRVELWGIPGLCTEKRLCDAVALASMTDGGTYVYVWDCNDGDLSDENLKFWLQHLSSKAHNAEVVFLGLNVDSSLADRIKSELKPFQDINQNLRRTLLVGSWPATPCTFVKEIKSILQAQDVREVIWFEMEQLAIKIEEKKVEKAHTSLETLNKRDLRDLAKDCGIKGEYQLEKAVKYLEETGLGLKIGGKEAYFVLNAALLQRNLQEVSCSHGTLEKNDLVGSKKDITDFLIEKNLACASPAGTLIYVVPFLEPLAEKTGSPSDSKKFTASRHLVLTEKPHVLHTIFPSLADGALKNYSEVCIARNALFIHDEKYTCRVDCGPCLVDKNNSEIRVVVRADSRKDCGTVADTIAASFCRFANTPKECIKLCCCKCLSYYFEQSVVLRAKEQRENRIKCPKCHKKMMSDNILYGYKEERALKDFKWALPTECRKRKEKPSAQALMKPVLHCIKAGQEHQYSEMKKEFSKIANLISDNEECTVPRTVCILPNEKFHILKRKWRLHLVCEGYGDGVGIHLIDHSGYPILDFSSFVEKCVPLLVVSLKFTLSAFKPGLEKAMDFIPSGEAFLPVLGGALDCDDPALRTTNWIKHIARAHKIIRAFKESGMLSEDEDQDGKTEPTAHHVQLYSDAYQQLKRFFEELGDKKGDFGGLVREPREGDRFVWVCKQHKQIPDEITSLGALEPAEKPH